MRIELAYKDFRDWFIAEEPYIVEDSYVTLNFDIREKIPLRKSTMDVYKMFDEKKHEFYRNTVSVWQSGYIKIPLLFNKILFIPEDDFVFSFDYMIIDGILAKINGNNIVTNLKEFGNRIISFSSESFSGKPYVELLLMRVNNPDFMRELYKKSGYYGKTYFKKGQYGFSYIKEKELENEAICS